MVAKGSKAIRPGHDTMDLAKADDGGRGGGGWPSRGGAELTPLGLRKE